MRVIRLSVGTLLAALVLSLSACVPVTSPAPGASPTPTLEPTAEPTAEVVTSVEITTLSLDVYSDNTMTDSWLHADRNPAEIAALTEYFGIEPTVSSETTPGEGADSTYEIQSWPGFEIRYIVSEFGPRGFFITATAATVGGVPIRAAGGAQVGDDLRALAALDPTAASTVPAPEGDLFRVKVDQIPVDSEGFDGPAADFVAVQSIEPSTTVTTIRAPTSNYGL